MNKAIEISDLVCMDEYADKYNYRIDLAYARNDNLLFKEQIYKSQAHLWLYKDLANVIFMAAQQCYKTHGLRFVLYDGLRTVEAQEKMMNTRRALENPHWMEPPRLLSTPSTGGHPRAMAIDIGLEDENGSLIDMGCDFDYLAESPDADKNPAHRNYKHRHEVKRNRDILDQSMLLAAKSLGIEITPLPEEWWDFRLPKSIYGQYAPIYDKLLPENMKMT